MCGQRMTAVQRNRMRNLAVSSRIWSHVDPASMTPTWVHFDRRRGPAACGAGYPLIRQGARGSYVLIAQDLLNTLGFTTRGLDGMFGPNTANATMAFQRRFGLVPDGVIGCNTWRALTTRGVGIGRTRTTID